ncbi:hypothetical protein V8B97DRAFT_660150 [Scleroderma yunnanense]
MATTSRTSTATAAAPITDVTSKAGSIWGKRKPTHLTPVGINPFSLSHRGSVLSTASSLVSNSPSAHSGSSHSDVPSDSTQRRTTLERLRRKLGDEVPADVVFASTPRTSRTAIPKSPRGTRARSRSRSRSRTRTRSIHMREDTQSITISISSDEGVQTVTLTPGTSHVHSPHPRHSHRPNHAYPTSALPPVPPIPTHLSSSSRKGYANDDDGMGLLRPRQRVGAGSRIGGADFKAARRAKRDGKTGHADVGEVVEMMGFMGARI